MRRQHLLAFRDLRRDPILQCGVCTEVSDRRIALHLNETAGNGPFGGIEVEEAKVGSLKADVIAELIGDSLQ